ncbi:dienelactone hydrolase family protein [Pleomorphomonas sp. NRK KF1]|uniref:dienelactone hydrolase family protein n=1 Tax=Pleomorphomonas sp. NRK KF1 TaxID=2943000 RepID=UPI002043327E|nr:dienelactone hydrolase family protein [Pleomorphomonas sp. NRK KF1]MCM5553939.1 dienelactone hydrolase family protein [Pleomorphomonas sp. NRK KF1]
MASVILFHSVLGLRPMELAAADRMRAAGHSVMVPDLFGGVTAETVDRGMELVEEIGWDTIRERAQAALAELPAATVLAGVSMGCGVVASVWPERPETAGLLLLHAPAEVPAGMNLTGLRAQLHVGEHDDFWPPEELRRWQMAAELAGMAAELHIYPGAGHFYTDPSLPDHHGLATEETWKRALKFLGEV